MVLLVLLGCGVVLELVGWGWGGATELRGGGGGGSHLQGGARSGMHGLGRYLANVRKADDTRLKAGHWRCPAASRPCSQDRADWVMKSSSHAHDCMQLFTKAASTADHLGPT